MPKTSLSKALIGASCTAFMVAIIAIAAISFPTRETRSFASSTSAHLHELKTAGFATRQNVPSKLASLPLAFEENVGQVDRQVKYMARGSGYTLFLTSSDAVLSLASSSPSKTSRPRQFMEDLLLGYSSKEHKLMQRHFESPKQTRSAAASLRMDLVDSNPAAPIEPRGLLPSKTNYFVGNNPREWHAGVKEFDTVSYGGVYPGVDLVYHGQQKQLEFDFVVAPNGSASPIRLKFAGAHSVELEKSGDLFLHSLQGDITLHKPVAYQKKNTGERESVEASFVLKRNHEIAFALGDYDKSRELVIDPSVSYATYIGGNADDEAYGIAVDANGNSYVTGESDSTSGFPGSNPSAGGYDCFVIKINADGSRGYTTFVGGSGDDLGSSIALNNSLTTGTVFVAGITTSTDLPVTSGAVQSTSGAPAGTDCTTGSGPGAPCTDGFVFELSPAGTPSYVTYLGGSSDDGAYAIAVDSSGNAYAAGFTFSADFPTATPLFSQLNGGNNTTFEDGFVAEINPTGTAYVYSTYFGGQSNDFASAIAVDTTGAAYITGFTTSTATAGFQVTSGAFQTQCGTDGLCNASNGRVFSDAFVTKFAPSGTSLAYSTYLGGSSDDAGTGISLDSSDNVYVTGQTTHDNSNVSATGDFPVAGGFEMSYGNGDSSAMSNAFVSELALNGQGASDLKYSSYLGGSTADTGMAIAADASGNAYVTGSTLSSDFPVFPTSNSALNGNSDAFVSYVASGGGSLVYSSYLGGSGDENFDPTTASFLRAGINVGGCGSATTGIYVAGITDSPSTSASTTFPVTASALESSYGGDPFDGFEATIGLIAGPDFAICATSPGAVSAGSSATSTVTLTSINDTNAVNLSCTVSGSGSPLPACGTFSTNPVTPTAGGATSTVTITTTGASGQLTSPSRKFFYALWLPMSGLVVVGVGVGSRSRRKKMLWLILVGTVVAALVFLPACGGSSGSSNNGGGGGGGGGSCAGCTPSGSYTVTVTGTGTNPATTHTATFTLTVN